jgi:hypothetical protein
MLRVLLYAIPIVLAIYAIVDCLQTPDDQLRGLPRFGWIVLILLFPLIGSIVWLFAGRPKAGTARRRIGWPTVPGAPEQRPTRRVVAPDDDPEFLRNLGRGNPSGSNPDHEALLEQWEEDLRRREGDLRGDGPDDAGPEAGGPAPRS